MIFRNILCILNIGLMKSGRRRGKSSSGAILYLRALQGHSGRNLLDPALQDTLVIPDDFFEYIYHIGMCDQCAFHHRFRIDSGRTKF